MERGENVNKLRAMLPERYHSPIYLDDEAAMRAFLDDVERLAVFALSTCRRIDRDAMAWPRDWANELHAHAAEVCPGVEDLSDPCDACAAKAPEPSHA
jgi:hypothetical protein